MNPARAVTIDDLRHAARRRLPNFIFDFIEGGVEDEHNVARNLDALGAFRLNPRVLVDVTRRSQATALWGRTYGSPFGISPTGPAPLYRRGADTMLARAAKDADIPFVLSGTSGASLESMHATAPEHAWYQLYGALDRSLTDRIVGRAADAGFPVLVVTADTPITPKRERHLRSGATVPLKLSPRMLLRLAGQAVLHPGWFVEYLLHGGMPLLETWAPYAPPGSSNLEVAKFFRAQSPSSQTWADLENVRRRWPGKLAVKGILNPADARRAVDLGCDAIWVSNHGGKVLDRAPASIEALPLVKAAVGDRAKVFVDGGIRRGSDIVVARCLGADFIFCGRATLYGVAAAGLPGAARAIQILREELDLVLGTMGRPNFEEIGPDCLFPLGVEAEMAMGARSS